MMKIQCKTGVKNKTMCDFRPLQSSAFVLIQGYRKVDLDFSCLANSKKKINGGSQGCCIFWPAERPFCNIIHKNIYCGFEWMEKVNTKPRVFEVLREKADSLQTSSPSYCNTAVISSTCDWSAVIWPLVICWSTVMSHPVIVPSPLTLPGYYSSDILQSFPSSSFYYTVLSSILSFPLPGHYVQLCYRPYPPFSFQAISAVL